LKTRREGHFGLLIPPYAAVCATQFHSVILFSSKQNLLETFKYAEGMRQATEALRDLMELVNMPDFEDREGWKRKNSNKNDVVFSKRYSMGKVFTMKVDFLFSRPSPKPG
uniref:Carn_acyltransf domain-containing protein n=1 Tax=Gongylonema pulchrum TaxID=637853 RepID=A0A183D0P3_9BILA